MKILKEDIRFFMKDIKLDLKEDYINEIYDIVFDIVLKLEKLKKINVQNIKPLNMIFENNYEDHLRDDNEVSNLKQSEIFSNSVIVKNNFFVLRKDK